MRRGLARRPDGVVASGNGLPESGAGVGNAGAFISYARKDTVFVRELYALLTDAGREVWIDWEDIPPASEFEKDIYAGIDEAESFVFVVSPSSLASEYCGREFQHALRQGKRIVPIACESSDENDAPEGLRQLNWIWCRAGDDRDAAYAKLTAALDSDLEWARAHTRLLRLAVDWEASPASPLLKGLDLKQSEAKLAQNEAREPKPTELQQRYVRASRAAASRRQRITLAAVASALAVSLALTAYALVTRSQSISREKTARSVALASAAKDQLATRLGASLLLSQEAVRASDTRQARDSMTSALAAFRGIGAETILHSGQGSVTGVAFSPDGSTLAASGDDGNVVLLDAHDFGKLTTLESGQSSLGGVAFSPDGSTLAAAGDSGEVELWDAAHDYSKLTTLESGQEFVSEVAFSPDGNTLAASGDDGNVVLWDAHDHNRLTTLESGQAVVYGVAFSRNTLAAAGGEGKVALWDAHNHNKLTTLESGQGSVVGVAFSPDGNTLAAAGGSGEVVLWDAGHAYRKLTTLESAVNRVDGVTFGIAVGGVAFSPDGSTLAAGGDSKVELWDAHDFGKLTTLQSGQRTVWEVSQQGFTRSPLGNQSSVVGVAFGPGNTLAAARDDGEVVLWDANDYSKFTTLESGQEDVNAVAFSPDGNTLASAVDDGDVVLWNANDDSKLTTLESGQEVYEVAFSPDGNTLVTAGSDLVLWDAHDFSKLTTLESGHEVVSEVAFSPDGNRLAAAGYDGNVVLWDTAHDYRKLTPLTSGQRAVWGFAFSPDGNTLAAVGLDGNVVLWDTAHDYRMLAPLDSGHGVNGVAFSPDGNTLAGAGSDGNVELWDAHDYSKLTTLQSGQSSLGGVAFSPDGSTLAAAGDDVELWDAAHDYSKLTTLESGQSSLGGVAFSPETLAFSPDTLAAAGTAGEVVLWDIFWHDLFALKAKVCGLVQGNLTTAEWEKFAPGLPYSTTCPG